MQWLFFRKQRRFQMSLFNPYEARPGLPYRATTDAALAAFLGFIIVLFVMNLVMGPLRPAQGATFLEHLIVILKNPTGWLQFVATYPLRVGGWYLVVLSVPFAIAGIVFIWTNQVREPFIHVRGRRLKQGKVAIRAARIATAKELAFGGGLGLKITKHFQISRRQEVQSIQVSGNQGGGKTVVINSILDAAIKANHKMVVYDVVKGDYTSIIPEPLILLSAWDKRGKAWWLAQDIIRFSDCTAFALGMVPDNDKDPMWTNAARGILIASLLYLIDKFGRDWGWKEFSTCVALPLAMQKEICDAYYPPASSSVADAQSKTTLSIKINLDAMLMPIWDLGRRWGEVERDPKRRFSVRQWLYDDNSKIRKVVIHGNNEDPLLTAAFGKALTEYMVSRISGLAFKESSSRRIWFFMDELLQLGKLSCMSTLMAIGRSKGICVVLSYQNVDQVRQVYPAHEESKWSALMGIKIIPQCKGEASQAVVLREIGTREVERRNRTISGTNGKTQVSDSWQRQEMAVMVGKDLETMIGPRKDGVEALILGHGSDALILHFPFSRLKEVRPGFVELKLPPITARPDIDLTEVDRLFGNDVAARCATTSIADGGAGDGLELDLEAKNSVTEAQQESEFTPQELNHDDSLHEPSPDMFDAQCELPEKVAVSEVMDTLASEIASQSVEHATGTPAVIGAIEILADLSAMPPDMHNAPPPQANSAPRKRKPRKYTHELRTEHEV